MRMTSSTVSSKFQVVIPREVRERLGIKPGQKVAVIPYEGRIELVPLAEVEESRGSLRGISTDVAREPDRA